MHTHHFASKVRVTLSLQGLICELGPICFAIETCKNVYYTVSFMLLVVFIVMYRLTEISTPNKRGVNTTSSIKDKVH